MKAEKKFLIAIIILIIILIANSIILFGILNSQRILVNYQNYYFDKTENLNHQERDLICRSHNLTYIKTLQNNKEIVTCCQLTEDGGLKHFESCEDIFIG